MRGSKGLRRGCKFASAQSNVFNYACSPVVSSKHRLCSSQVAPGVEAAANAVIEDGILSDQLLKRLCDTISTTVLLDCEHTLRSAQCVQAIALAALGSGRGSELGSYCISFNNLKVDMNMKIIGPLP